MHNYRFRKKQTYETTGSPIFGEGYIPEVVACLALKLYLAVCDHRAPWLASQYTVWSVVEWREECLSASVVSDTIVTDPTI